jgi:hypothetical protein
MVEGSPVPGEVLGYYRRQALKKPCALCYSIWMEHEHGIGRYRSVKARVSGRDVLVVEPIWEKPWSQPHPALRDQLHDREVAARIAVLDIVDIRFNAATGELLALVTTDPMRASTRDDVELVAFSAEGLGPQRRLDLEETRFGSMLFNTYSSIGVGPTGHAFVLDGAGSQAAVIAPNGTPAGTVPVSGDTLRVVGGPDGSLFALLRSGMVERRRVADGAVTARFDARPTYRSDPGTLRDLAVDANAWVYVVDGLASQVLVFAPAGALPARPAETGTCGFTAAKAAAPERLFLGDTTRITLALDGYCSTASEPTDIVLLTPGAPPQQRRPLYRAVLKVLTGLDMSRHRIGMIDVGSNPRLLQGLTHDRADAVHAMGKLLGPSHNNLRTGLILAQKQFTAGDGRRHVILLLPMFYCSEEVSDDPVRCRISGHVPAESAAREATAAGTIVVVDQGCPAWNLNGYCYNWSGAKNDLRILASSNQSEIPTGADPIPYLLDFALPSAPAIDVEVVDGLPENMHLVPGSSQPPAVVGASRLSWRLPRLADAGARFSFDLKPQSLGRWPTNTEAVTTFTDGWGRPWRLVFPVPEVEVVAAAPTLEPTPVPPTPVPPTVTGVPSMAPTPASATPPVPAPTPTRATAPGRVFLPLAWRDGAGPTPSPQAEPVPPDSGGRPDG